MTTKTTDWLHVLRQDHGPGSRPGSSYKRLVFVLQSRTKGKVTEYQLTAVLDRGSDQGHLESHEREEFTSRGECPTWCIDELQDDVIERADGFMLSAPFVRQAFRDLIYEWEDMTDD